MARGHRARLRDKNENNAKTSEQKAQNFKNSKTSKIQNVTETQYRNLLFKGLRCSSSDNYNTKSNVLQYGP